MNMNTYIIVLEQLSMGRKVPSMVTRQPSQEAAHTYAEEAIAKQPNAGDLRVAEIYARPAR